MTDEDKTFLVLRRKPIMDVVEQVLRIRQKVDCTDAEVDEYIEKSGWTKDDILNTIMTAPKVSMNRFIGLV